MDEETAIEKFAILEDTLNKILKGYTALKEENERTASRIREQEEEAARLREEITRLKGERLEIRTRIGRLIERLEGVPLE
jgi:predicted nuclease with TOPRIM domain